MTHGDEIELPGLAPSSAVLAAEMAVLGAAIESKRAAETAAEIVRPADYWKSAHVLIAEAIDGLIEAGKPVNPVSVLKEITDRGAPASMNPAPTLHTLMEQRSADVRYDARIVAEDAVRRNVLIAVRRGMQIAARSDFEPDVDIDRIRQQIDAAASRVTGDQLPTIGEIVLKRLDELEHGLPADKFVPAPYDDLEMTLSGLRPGQVVVIGARPSVGKTVVGLDFARNAAIRLKLPTLIFSLEMGATELADRLLAAEASIDLTRIRDHRLTDDDWSRIGRKQDGIQQAPLVIDDSPHCSLGRIRARLRGMARTDPARLVIVDYIGLMDAPKADSRERQVAELSRGLKLLAKEFQVPILALSQLNRESTKRSDRRPTMADLRDSGAVEQDADMVLLLHREDVHDKESPRAGELDVIVDKNRNGPTGTVILAFQGRYARAASMSRATPPAHRGHLAAVPD